MLPVDKDEIDLPFIKLLEIMNRWLSLNALRTVLEFIVCIKHGNFGCAMKMEQNSLDGSPILECYCRLNALTKPVLARFSEKNKVEIGQFDKKKKTPL